jgi:hypothetical protein
LKYFYEKYNSHEKRIDIIEEVISKDPIYAELIKINNFNRVDRIYTLRDIAVCANDFMELYANYNLQNPIESKFKEKICFEPDKRHIRREGRKNAGIKYAVHFVTSVNEKTSRRYYDSSKIAYFNLIRKALMNADHRIVIKNNKGEFRINYYYKLEKDTNMEIICEFPTNEIPIPRLITFIPDKEDEYVLKKLSPQ